MLNPADLGLLLYRMLYPREAFSHAAAMLGVSKGTVHNSAERLRKAGLLHRFGPRAYEVARGPALEFVCFGAPYAFAPSTVPKARGVPTGLGALALDADAGMPEPMPQVWPSRLGTTVGLGVEPLVPAAPDIALRDPRLYRLLALVDALRLGDAREREYARSALQTAMQNAMQEASA